YGIMAAVCLLLPYEKSVRDGLYFVGSGQTYVSNGYWPAGIADERWYYIHPQKGGMNLIQENEIVGKQLKLYFQGHHVSALLIGEASLGYFAGFDECIENQGLTDAYIAKLPLTGRGRIGHEKHAPLEYLEKREVNFVFAHPPYREEPYRFVYFSTPFGQL